MVPGNYPTLVSGLLAHVVMRLNTPGALVRSSAPVGARYARGVPTLVPAASRTRDVPTGGTLGHLVYRASS